MKYLLSILTLVFSLTLTAQDDSIRPLAEDPSPYPVVGASPESDKEAIFMSFFNKDVNVGNLHVFSFLNEPTEDYYFLGNEISRGFADMFTGDLRQTRVAADAKFYGVMSIRGEGRPYYIIRSYGKSGVNNHLALYELNEGKLTFKLDLASATRAGKGVKQVDSWILDLDGDTLLDVISITAQTGKNGEFVKKEQKVYLQNENGTLLLEEDYDLSPYMYLSEDLQKM